MNFHFLTPEERLFISEVFTLCSKHNCRLTHIDVEAKTLSIEGPSSAESELACELSGLLYLSQEVTMSTKGTYSW